MNILLLSVGIRNKIIQFFKQTISGRVVATDMQNMSPALYEADAFYIVPPITDPQYVDTILGICREEKIDAVMSLIDPELLLLAENAQRFSEMGVKVIGSSCELCERALDKMAMFRWLVEKGYHCARSYDSLETFSRDFQEEKVHFPVFVKPVRGSASLSAFRVEDMPALREAIRKNPEMMIQEFLNGQEIGVDAYVDMISGETVSIFTKKKIVMRAGETAKAVSFKDEKLFKLIEQFVADSGWRGQIDIDMFAIDGNYYFSEVNPRFGGGYPHAYLCGCNHMKLIENNVNGIVNEKCIGSYEEGIYMMKFSDLLVMKL